MSRTTRSLLVALAALTTLGGCSLGPREDPSRFYVLPSPEIATDDASGLTVGLGPVSLPDYLDRPEIVVRRSDVEVELRRWDRWAEPLDAAVVRVVSDVLRVHVARVEAYPWRGRAPVDRAVIIEVVRFECDAAGDAALDARWSITRGDETSSYTFQEQASAAPGDLPGGVKALGALATRLGEAIAAELRPSP